MLDVSALKAKIESLKNEIIQDSISPMRLGIILEELLKLLRKVYQANLTDDIEQAIREADTALNKARTALEILEQAIRLHLEASRVSIVDRGIYDPQATYYYQTLNPATGVIETSDVWYGSCRFRCLATGTGQIPEWSSTDWMFIEGNPYFTVEFRDTDYLFDPDSFECPLEIVAWMYNQDITDDILDADVVWTRYSEDAEGRPRPASDAAWAAKRIGAGKSITITRDDCDFNGYTPKTLRFTATVTLRDGSPSEPVASTSFEY